MAENMNGKIDINSAPAKNLTQLPGIAVNMARAIVNHRQRHGLFTSFEELLEVNQFPAERLDEIRERAVLEGLEGALPPRHLDTTHLAKMRKKTAANTRALRSTRGKDRSHDTTGHRPPKQAA